MKAQNCIGKQHIQNQGNGKRLGGDNEEEEAEEEGDVDHFLLPGDEGFEDDRPMEENAEDKGGKGSGDEDDRMSHKDVLQACRLLENNSEGEDDTPVSAIK